MIIPQNNNVLVKPLDREVKTGSGIIMSQSVSLEEGLSYGEIVHPGTSSYKKNDKIFFSKYSAVWVADETGKSFQMICYLDIMGLEE